MAKPKIIIVGGGFAGLAAAKALRKTPAKVDLIDRTNHGRTHPRAVLTSVADTDTMLMPIHFPAPTAGRIESDGTRFRYRFRQ